MGIADFGVDQNLNSYVYNTTQFYGDTRVAVLKTYSSGVFPTTQMGIQLNVVLWFDSGGTSYYYWIQDVAFIDTSTNSINFLNNVWNFSASGAGLTSSDLNGNGSVQGNTFYYAGASSILPGNFVTLTSPYDVGLKVVSTHQGGHPLVKFEYQDGGGWVTYDDVVFSASPVKLHDFIVDGSQYNPDSLFNNAELILGGPGGGSSVAVNASASRMTLSFWNGHNFQAITNAYNHGSDTAEGVSNSVVLGRHFVSNGTLFANLTSGSGSLGSLYDRSYAGILNITTPYKVGSLRVNATSEGNFTGGEMNLTLAPGKYRVSLYENATLEGIQNFTLAAGAYMPVFFGAGPRYNITFTQTGLPNGTNWSVTAAGFTRYSTTNSLRMPIWNGTWTYKLGFISGWAASSPSGQLLVAGGTGTISTIWSRVFYTAVFTQKGLPANSNWSVSVGNTTLHGVNPSLTFLEPNGSLSYQIGPVPGYIPTPVTGNAFVQGFNVRISISWSIFSYPITFTSTGLPMGTQWNVTSGSATAGTTSNVLVLNLPNGSQPWSTSLVPGYRPSQGSRGQVAVQGASANVQLNWGRVVYTVTIQETGLAPGTTWQAIVGNASATGSTSSLTVDRLNGTYVLSLGKTPGYVPIYYPANVAVRGKSMAIPVTFAASTTVITFQVVGLPSGSTWTVSAQSGSTWQNATGTLPFLNVSLANGSWSYTVTVPSGWLANPSTGVLTVTGPSTLVSIQATKASGYLVGTISPTDSTLYVDGHPVTSSGGSFNATLTVGLHSIEVTASGYEPFFENVTILQGKALSEKYLLTRTPSSTTTAGLGGIPIVGLALLAIVVLAAAVAIALVRRRRPPTEQPEEEAAPPEQYFGDDGDATAIEGNPDEVDPAFQ